MLTRVVVLAPPGAAYSDYEMPVLAPGPNGLFLSKVEGLEPVAQNVNTKNYGIGDGEYFVGKHRGKRNIVLSFGMESRGIDVDVARHELYGHFYTQTSLWLKLDFDNRGSLVIEGYPETHESDRFAQDVEAQISIICPKPNFIDPNLSTLNGMTGLDPAMTNVVNLGDQSIGFQIQITPNAGATELGSVLYETAVETDVPGVYSTDHRMFIDATNYPHPIDTDAGEVFVLDSRQGQKSVYILNPTTGDRRNAMKGMTNWSRWPILHPGDNKFRISTPDSSVDRRWDIVWQSEFGGV